MKKLILLVLACFLVCSCSNSELYKETDKLVLSLDTTYDRYGLLDIADNSVTSSDGLYSITPIGRLINVKIKKGADKEQYEDLKEDLGSYYKNDKRVNKVYICEGGTVVIDCRN